MIHYLKKINKFKTKKQTHAVFMVLWLIRHKHGQPHSRLSRDASQYEVHFKKKEINKQIKKDAPMLFNRPARPSPR